MRNTIKRLVLGVLSTTALLSGTLSAAASTTGTSTQTKTVAAFASSAPRKLAPSTRLTYIVEGMKQTVKANLFVSSQGYHMYVLQGYKASAEEPGKDIVLFSRNQNNFMRIEKLPAGVDINSVRVNVITSLKAVGKVESISPKSYGDVFLKNAAYIYHTHNKSVNQIVYVIKIKGDFYRILVNTKVGTESITPFWAMIKTIDGTSPMPSGQGTGIVAGSIQPSIIQQSVGADGSFNFVLQVKNQTEQLQQLTFNTGQQYDYILSKDGVVVAQYSRGKMFSMHVEVVTLKQGETLQFPIQLTGLEAGNYHLEAWVTYATSNNTKATVDFTIPS